MPVSSSTALSVLYYVKISGVSSATIGTETTHAHLLANIPLWYIILPLGNGVVYESKAADQTNIYIKASAASISFIIIAVVA